ncbi:Trk-type K+ transport system membrane component [Synechococcus sp. Ace-Pa]|nr:potassium transporter TrkG [Synechococcus sp. CS-603]MCT0246487.1 potassium transporter TrkG [Synechococcus sp. CS-601]TWB93247.1 Trk-type K+ transport system membrane component [Synechococcus sp. Ace-Pa]
MRLSFSAKQRPVAGQELATRHSWLTLVNHWRSRLTVPQFTLVSGVLVIVFGTMLMALPAFSNANVGIWEALFTVTSAITVTGLTIVNVGEDLTFAGQLLLLLLILTGGLGLMAITTFLQGFVQGGTGLRRRLDRGRTLDEFGVGGVGSTFHSILITAAWMVGLGTVLLFSYGFRDIASPGERLWASLFHCISAYCNAGFGLWGDSLEGYRGNPVVNAVIALMIVAGGIGYRVTNDLWLNRFKVKRIRSFCLHTRLVLRWSLGLVVFGALGLLFTEHVTGSSGLTSLPWWQEIQVVIFQSVSTRTAGFNTVPLSAAAISEAGMLLMMTLMFIGASPGGTGGGIKTTTFAALVAATRSTLMGLDTVVIRRRAISDKVVLRAVGVTLASLLFVLLMALVLGLDQATSADGHTFTFLDKLFTCISAFATVGLDVGVTSALNRWGQLVLMVGMFVGRIGILLLLSAIFGKPACPRVSYQHEDLYV